MCNSKHLLIFALLLNFITAFSQLPYDAKVRPEALVDRVLSEGELSALMREVPNRPDLQLERLAAYFFHQRINYIGWIMD